MMLCGRVSTVLQHCIFKIISSLLNTWEQKVIFFKSSTRLLSLLGLKGKTFVLFLHIYLLESLFWKPIWEKAEHETISEMLSLFCARMFHRTCLCVGSSWLSAFQFEPCRRCWPTANDWQQRWESVHVFCTLMNIFAGLGCFCHFCGRLY